MANGTFDKDEFWKALGRLYDETLQLRDSLAEQRATADDLLRVAQIHQNSLQQHEKRLDRTEVTVEAILEDLRRHREGRA